MNMYIRMCDLFVRIYNKAVEKLKCFAHITYFQELCLRVRESLANGLRNHTELSAFQLNSIPFIFTMCICCFIMCICSLRYGSSMILTYKYIIIIIYNHTQVASILYLSKMHYLMISEAILHQYELSSILDLRASLPHINDI